MVFPSSSSFYLQVRRNGFIIYALLRLLSVFIGDSFDSIKFRNVHTYRHKISSPNLKWNERYLLYFCTFIRWSWLARSKKKGQAKFNVLKVFFLLLLLVRHRSCTQKHGFQCVCSVPSECQTIENLPAINVTMAKICIPSSTQKEKENNQSCTKIINLKI